MMLMPRRNDFDLFDDLNFDSFFPTKNEKNLMKADVRETSDKYIVDIDLPGFEKENISVSLKDGYLKISAKQEKNEDSDDEKFVRRERFFGECSRSFYVGDDITEDDIEAKFKNGTLRIDIPKKETKDDSETVKQIEIK